MKILHIAISEKFMPPFIELIEDKFDIREHTFAFITSEKYEYGLKPSSQIIFCHRDYEFFELEKLMVLADKIVLHGIWRNKINQLLSENLALLKKTYWFMWGAEFYFPERYDKAHKDVIKHSKFLVSGVEGDIELIREIYDAQGEYIEGMVYAKYHNLHRHPFVTHKEKVNILLGNSAAETNNHIKAIDMISADKYKIEKVFTPLSYAGKTSYIEEIDAYGNKELGDKFIPIKEYFKLDSYLKFLTSIDIAVFNHDRQQGINNILILLEIGKKIYMRSDITTFKQLTKKGFHIFDIEQFNTAPLTKHQASENYNLIKLNYSKEKTLKTLNKIFN
ncbi:TDP-N-acetylfucosamine:lipid II N-acetylfucosaminyltransferase [Paraglaciecola chathamensis]|uniref:TDP-N-acetylfucosamine:lipid II N-acetylfucosaminyltransferase n=1 Tax=Paraglaciecola chathamensis TaxID=368405 RepID=UPI0026FD1BB6|nr:TDP-N-acetylfucosamine:lipid II N-acetylfucosaminyltransferase [Paraglaciecola chathamensis]MDO6838190.1 TDP-N-acetylfucosamine:lipid II N-acetylfucosaminyltransferase [Paraglaciecola chathamensis]